jgi:hypothetical protein
MSLLRAGGEGWHGGATKCLKNNFEPQNPETNNTARDMWQNDGLVLDSQRNVNILSKVALKISVVHF